MKTYFLYLMKTRLLIILSAIVFVGCTNPTRNLSGSSSEAIKVDSSFESVADTSYTNYLVPIKASKDSVMNQVIGVAPEQLVRVSPESNLMNWSADALLDIARKVTGRQVDAAVVNKGGLRCDIPKGNVTIGTIYSLMPFDNALVVLTMEGRDIIDLCNTFAHRGGEGMSGIRLTINGEKAQNITIGGKPIVEDAVYYIATSDYLSTGTDEMVAFTRAIDKLETGRIIRELYIDYVREKGVMSAEVDGRTSVVGN